MTDTETKLHDAVMQFDLAANTEDEAMVRSCVNAMIDMGRSVTLVMQKESGPYPALTQWYERRMAELMQSADLPVDEVLQRAQGPHDPQGRRSAAEAYRIGDRFYGARRRGRSHGDFLAIRRNRGISGSE
jgi:hypothetical protein